MGEQTNVTALLKAREVLIGCARLAVLPKSTSLPCVCLCHSARTLTPQRSWQALWGRVVWRKPLERA